MNVTKLIDSEDSTACSILNYELRITNCGFGVRFFLIIV